MIENPKTQMEIQIESEEPFIPEKVFECGIVYGTQEKTLDKDFVKSFEISSHYAVVHYVYKGKEVHNFYKNGAWKGGTNGMPRFGVSEILS